ncbi:MAG: hypothetical protein QM811_18105 [Pirellulales bacterium]
MPPISCGTSRPGPSAQGDSAVTGGLGTWNTILGTWTTDNGANNFAWDNTLNAADTAVFGGAAGTVTLGSAITIGGLRFETTGYTLATGINALNTGAAAATITFTPSNSVATITGYTTGTAGGLTGSGGLTVAGPGKLILTDGLANFTETAITTGSGSATFNVNSSSTLEFSGDTAAAVGAARQLGGSGTIIFTGTNTGTLTSVSSYALSANNGATGSAFSGTLIANNSRLNIDAQNDVGSASLVTTGPGGQIFASATGLTLTNSMTLQGVGWGETAGNLGALRLGNAAIASGTITLAGDTRITTHASTGVISGPIGETGGVRTLEIGGSSSTTALTLSGNNTYTGGTILNGVNQLTGNILGAGSTLTLDYAGAKQQKTGERNASRCSAPQVSCSPGGSSAETAASTTLGTNAVASITRSSSAGTIALGAITVGNGAHLNIGAIGLATTTNTNVNGILGPWALFNNADYATNDGSGNIIAATYTDVPFAGTIADGATSNVRLTGGTSGNVTLTTPDTTIYTLLQNQATAVTIATTSATLRLSALLVPSGKGTLTIGSTLNAGTLTAGIAPNVAGTLELNTIANAVVNATIAENGTGAASLYKLVRANSC